MVVLSQAIRYSIRRIMRSPGFSLIVIVTLAIGIGANTTIFSVLNERVLKPLPYPDASELVSISHFYPSLNELEAPVSAPGFRRYESNTQSYSSMGVATYWLVNLTGLDEPARLEAGRVTHRYFETLGIAPALGRGFTQEEEQLGNHRVAVISDGFWRERLGADPDVLERTLELNGETFAIVGVMPPGFRDFWNSSREIWGPLALEPERLDNESEYLGHVARLAPGVTLESATDEISAFAESLKEEFPDRFDQDWTLHLRLLDDIAKGYWRTPLFLLLGAVCFVLLIACANVANLVLARSIGRVKEVAIRRALGSGRSRLIAQVLTESVLLALSGGLMGLLVARWGISGLRALQPNLGDVTINAGVLLFTFLISLLTGVLFGLLPALQISRTNIACTIREGGLAGEADRSGRGARRVLVVAEIGIALPLLVGAGLLIKSFALINQVDPGFRQQDLLTVNVSLPDMRYPDEASQIAFYDQALERLGTLPGIEAVGMTVVLPFSGGWWTSSFAIEGYTPAENEPAPWGDFRIVGPGFAGAMGIPVLRGRFFTPGDDMNSRRVVVVDEELAERYWPDEDPIGRKLILDDTDDPDSPRWEIIGVVSHCMQEGLDADPRVQVYISYRQSPINSTWFVVRTAGDPLSHTRAIQAAVWEVDPDLPVAEVGSMSERIARSIGDRHLMMLLLTLFAAIALLLASLGIFGIMSHMVTRRSRELGIRMALGADSASLVRLVLEEGASLTGLGMLVGAAGTIAIVHFIRSQLFEVGTFDILTYITVVLVLVAVSLLAIVIPAVRAIRLDPVRILRQE